MSLLDHDDTRAGWTLGQGPRRRLAPHESVNVAVPRSDCVDGERPCARQCRYRLNDPNASCSLDIAALGEHTLDQVGALLGGLTRERVRQIETQALLKLRIRVQHALAEERRPPRSRAA